MRGWAGLTHGIVVASGNLCTTAYLGGRYDLGVVFEIYALTADTRTARRRNCRRHYLDEADAIANSWPITGARNGMT
jgi:hypothetical protein